MPVQQKSASVFLLFSENKFNHSVLQHFHTCLIMDEENYDYLPAKYKQLYTPQELGLLDYQHLTQENQFQFVYKPNDDSFLILSTLRHQLQGFKEDLFLCEIGSGSGIISANLHNWLKQAGKPPLLHVSIDLSMDASLLSKRYFDKYSLNIQQINTSIFNNLTFSSDNFHTRPQVIVFNPPYVPVEQEEIDNQHKYLVSKLKYVREEKKCVREKDQNLIAYSYMGGLDGLQVTRKILGKISWSCVVYFIVMGYEGLQSIEEEIKTGKTLHPDIKSTGCQLLQYHQFWNEHLFVVKATLQKE